MTRYLHGHRSSLRRAGLARWADAQALFDASRYAGAVYLAGYKVECDLKVALMEIAGVDHLRDLEPWLQRQGPRLPADALHNLEVLAAHHPGVKRLVEQATTARGEAAVSLTKMRIHAKTVCERWHTARRYDPSNLDRKSARRFLDAVELYSTFILSSF